MLAVVQPESFIDISVFVLVITFVSLVILKDSFKNVSIKEL